MAAYAALITLKRSIEGFLGGHGILLDPHSLEMITSTYNAVKSFEEFLKRLDSSSRSRKRMKASLGRIAEAIAEFDALLVSRFSKKIYLSLCAALMLCEGNPSRDVEDIHSVIEMLTGEEQHKLEALSNPLPDDDAAISSRIDLSENKSTSLPVKDLQDIHLFTETFKNVAEKVKEATGKPLPEDENDDDDILLRIASDGTKTSVGLIDLQDMKQDTLSFIEMLKKMEEEHKEESLMPKSLPEEEDDGAAVSSRSKMVGLSDMYNKVKATIIKEKIALTSKVFILAGTAGIGKTSLATKIFEDLDISEWFDCCAWVEVGIKCPPKQIPQSILAKVLDPPTMAKVLVEGDHEEMGEHLRRSLQGRRYLIVLDDVWDPQVYFHLKSFLPDEDNGSTVLLTTRVPKEAYKAAAFHTYSLNVRFLNNEESWDLLREKVFAEEPCPPQLVKAGRKIAKHCDGLPLMIVTVAKLLSTAKKTPEYWNQVAAAQRKHPLFIDAYNEISEVLYPSYEYLTEQLKLCFLYMGVFPLNYEIPRSKLINLWIAEGFFTPEITGQTSEERAVKCLQELASNTLVMVCQLSTNRSSAMLDKEIKTCALHSSWLHLCRREARKINFYYVLDSLQDGLEENIKSESRLCIHNNVLFGIKYVKESIEECCAATARSLLCFGPYHQYPVPVCFGLSLLQQLDALTIRFYTFPFEVLKLVQLKYLGLTYNGKLPPSISELWKLQYLIVHPHMNIKSVGATSYSPMEIWDMKELKHLQILGSDLPDPFGSSLENLLTLQDVSSRSCTKGVFESVPFLKKLGVRIELVPDAAEPFSCFDHISNLNCLKSFRCVVVNPEVQPDFVFPRASFPKFPSGLRKLSLSGLGYPWGETNKIASYLPELEVLKLRCNAFRGPKWEIENNQFMKLRYLLIEDTNLEQLKFRGGNFLKLRCLSMRHCYKLKKLNVEYDMLSFEIEVVDCNPHVLKQIKRLSLENKFVKDPLVHHSVE